MIIISTRRAGVFDEHGVYSEGWEQLISFSDAEMAELLAAYDPESGTSPSVSTARPVLRELLDAVLAQIALEIPHPQ